VLILRLDLVPLGAFDVGELGHRDSRSVETGCVSCRRRRSVPELPAVGGIQHRPPYPGKPQNGFPQLSSSLASREAKNNNSRRPSGSLPIDSREAAKHVVKATPDRTAVRVGDGGDQVVAAHAFRRSRLAVKIRLSTVPDGMRSRRAMCWIEWPLTK
jgi:hypothetical protein